MDNVILGLYLGHITFMLGLYLLADEISNSKIAKNMRMIALGSLLFGGFGLMILSIHKM